MRYFRKWFLPELNFTEALDHPAAYGESWFWYCIHCREPYASAELLLEVVPRVEYQSRPWRGFGGICPLCEGHRFHVPGDIPVNPMNFKTFPEAVIRYIFNCEIKFLDSPNHPYNEKEDK